MAANRIVIKTLGGIPALFEADGEVEVLFVDLDIDNVEPSDLTPLDDQNVILSIQIETEPNVAEVDRLFAIAETEV